jgi:hypothetical protein
VKEALMEENKLFEFAMPELYQQVHFCMGYIAGPKATACP